MPRNNRPRVRQEPAPPDVEVRSEEEGHPERIVVIPECSGLEHIFYGPFESGPGSYSKTDDNSDLGREAREAFARSLCEQCPLIVPCREFALVNQEDWGVWGGLTEGDRREFFRWAKRWGYDSIPERPELDHLIEWFFNDRFGTRPPHHWRWPDYLQRRQ